MSWLRCYLHRQCTGSLGFDAVLVDILVPVPKILTLNMLNHFNDNNPESKVHGANMGPTWVLSAPDGPHVGPMNLATWETIYSHFECYLSFECLTQVDEINSGTTVHVVCPTQPIPWLMIALATLGARESADMILTPKAGIFPLQHQKS